MKQQKSWNGKQSDDMFDYIIKEKGSGTKQKVAYALWGKRTKRSARSVESKYQKMLGIKNGGGTDNREIPNEAKKKGRRGTLSLVRYYAKDANGLDTPLGTGTSMDTLLAVIQAIQNDSGAAQ